MQFVITKKVAAWCVANSSWQCTGVLAPTYAEIFSQTQPSRGVSTTITPQIRRHVIFHFPQMKNTLKYKESEDVERIILSAAKQLVEILKNVV